jgi:bacterial leucyl aminopeptidase
MRSSLGLLAGFVFAVAVAGCQSDPTPSPSNDPEDPGEAEEQGARYITIGADALETAQLALEQRMPGSRLEVIEQYGGVALLEFDVRDFRMLSSLMHDLHNRCGGFMLHESLDAARSELPSKELEGLAPLIAYTIDNAATVNAVLPELSEAKILTHIQELSGLATRYYTSTTGAQASTQLRDKWQAIATAANRTDVTVELFTHTWAQSSVIVTIPGSTLANEVVVIGGHLDSTASPNTNAPGADDDASGIATLSEVYRALIAKNYRPLRTVRFMAYAAEEVGLRGSKAIVAAYQAQQVNVVGVMQLDMTNYKGSTQDIVLMTDFTNAAQNTFLGQLIDAYVHVAWTTDACGYGCSDHASWHNAGFAASIPFESKMNQYNPFIHTANDTLAKSNNSASHAIKFARTAAAYVVELAKGNLGGGTNTPPVVTISAPTAGQTFPQGSQIQLTGAATDAQDGEINGALRWSSSIDGSLGSGPSLTVTLTPGAHTISAAATDAGGATTTTDVAITVSGPPAGDFRDDFEGASTWTFSGQWHLTNNSSCLTPSSQSPTHALYFGTDSTCKYNGLGRQQGTATSPAITGIKASSALTFKFFRKVEAANGQYDVTSVEIVTDTGTTTVWTRSSANASSTAWASSESVSLSAFAGKSINVRFRFDSKDGSFNNFLGWFVDDVVVTR